MLRLSEALTMAVMDVKYVGDIYSALAQHSQSGDRDRQCSVK